MVYVLENFEKRNDSFRNDNGGIIFTTLIKGEQQILEQLSLEFPIFTASLIVVNHVEVKIYVCAFHILKRTEQRSFVCTPPFEIFHLSLPPLYSLGP